MTMCSSRLRKLSLHRVCRSRCRRRRRRRRTYQARRSFLLSCHARSRINVLLERGLRLNLNSIRRSFSLRTAQASNCLALVRVVSNAHRIFIRSRRRISARSLIEFRRIIRRMVNAMRRNGASRYRCQGRRVITRTNPRAIVRRRSGRRHARRRLRPCSIGQGSMNKRRYGSRHSTRQMTRSSRDVLPITHVTIRRSYHRSLRRRRRHRLSRQNMNVPRHRILMLSARRGMGRRQSSNGRSNAQRSLTMGRRRRNKVCRYQAHLTLSRSACRERGSSTRDHRRVLRLVSVRSVTTRGLHRDRHHDGLARLNELRSRQSRRRPKIQALSTVQVRCHNGGRRCRRNVSRMNRNVRGAIIRRRSSRTRHGKNACPCGLRAQANARARSVIITVNVTNATSASPTRTRRYRVSTSNPPIRQARGAD